MAADAKTLCLSVKCVGFRVNNRCRITGRESRSKVLGAGSTGVEGLECSRFWSRFQCNSFMGLVDFMLRVLTGC